MTRPANIRSTDAIDDFREAIYRFEVRAQNALDTLSAEMRRALDWLEYDCPADWKKQTKRAEDNVHQAKLDLERCLAFPVADERPVCRDQRAALKKAQTRLNYCREQSHCVQRWNRQMQHEQFEFSGRLGQLQRLLEADLPAARAKLQSIVRRLDEYQIERPPTDAGVRPVVSGPSAPGQATPVAPEEPGAKRERSDRHAEDV
ncbi:MAG: cobalamin biosynthesis protein [Pirellulales bacterium]|nr:cobalamin biosynthesis protein [Pirellulales bacterium]